MKKSKLQQVLIKTSHEYGRKIMIGLASFGLTIFLFLNIFAVQQVTPLYEDVANGEISALIRFFGKAKSLAEFQTIFPEVKQTFGLYEENVYAEDRKRQESIAQLELILQKNPQARDVLYALSKLYEKEENKLKAAEYLARAKQIDPQIGK